MLQPIHTIGNGEHGPAGSLWQFRVVTVPDHDARMQRSVDGIAHDACEAFGIPVREASITISAVYQEPTVLIVHVGGLPGDLFQRIRWMQVYR